MGAYTLRQRLDRQPGRVEPTQAPVASQPRHLALGETTGRLPDLLPRVVEGARTASSEDAAQRLVVAAAIAAGVVVLLLLWLAQK